MAVILAHGGDWVVTLRVKLLHQIRSCIRPKAALDVEASISVIAPIQEACFTSYMFQYAATDPTSNEDC